MILFIVSIPIFQCIRLLFNYENAREYGILIFFIQNAG
jgi:hypothetical protein